MLYSSTDVNPSNQQEELNMPGLGIGSLPIPDFRKQAAEHFERVSSQLQRGFVTMREGAGLSQKELAEKICVSTEMVVEMETNFSEILEYQSFSAVWRLITEITFVCDVCEPPRISLIVK